MTSAEEECPQWHDNRREVTAIPFDSPSGAPVRVLETTERREGHGISEPAGFGELHQLGMSRILDRRGRYRSIPPLPSRPHTLGVHTPPPITHAALRWQCETRALFAELDKEGTISKVHSWLQAGMRL